MSSFQDVIGLAGPTGPPGPDGPIGPAGLGGVLLASGGPGSGVYMSTAEIAMGSFTVSAGKIKAGDRIRFVCYFINIQNSQAPSYTYRFKIAGVTNVTLAWQAPIALNQRSITRIEHEMLFHTVTSQETWTQGLMSAANTQIGYQGAGAPAAAAAQWLGFTGSAVNFASAVAISWTVQCNMSTVGDSSMSSNGWMAELLPAP